MAATAAVAVSVVTVMVVAPAANSLVSASQTKGYIISPPVAAAGRWLRQHNTGGTIITTPYMNRSVSNRAVLAMGGYAGLLSNSRWRTGHPRQLPPAGRQPLLDSYQVLNYPASCQSARVLDREDVRYVVLYTAGHEADFAGFHADQALYHRVFENGKVVIYAAQHRPPELIAAGRC